VCCGHKNDSAQKSTKDGSKWKDDSASLLSYCLCQKVLQSLPFTIKLQTFTLLKCPIVKALLQMKKMQKNEPHFIAKHLPFQKILEIYSFS
jgi:hypothetical protein